MSRRALVLALVVTFLAPAYGAASGSALTGVGSFAVDATGHAHGANLGVVVSEATGRLADVTPLARGRPVLDGFAIDGFRPTSKLAGVGSSVLELRGTTAVLTVADSLHTPIVVRALDAVDASADLAAGVLVDVAADGRRADLSDAEGPLGSFFVLGPGALSSDGTRVDAALQEGATFAWRGLAPGADAGLDAAVLARATAAPLAEVVSEHVGSGTVFSALVYAARGSVATAPLDGGLVVTTNGVRAVAFDLAYETLPARRAGDVVVFVDGVPAPAEVRTTGDRATVLVDLADEETHRVVVAASGHGRTERQALAEGRSRSEASIEGSFTLHGDRAAGLFAAFRVDREAARILDLTMVHTGVQAIASLDLTGDGPARVLPEGDSVVLEARTSRTEVHDDPYATLVVDALAPAQAVVELGEGVRVVAAPGATASVVGPDGFEATFFVTMNDGSAAAASGLAETAPGMLLASLEQDARLVFRAEPRGADAVLTQALGRGEIDAQVVAGFAEGRPAARGVAYADGATVTPASAEPGRVGFAFAGDTFALDARGGVLAAKQPGDLRVLVDGEPATPASDLEAVLGSPAPAYFVSTGVDGEPRIVVRAHGGGDVVVESRLVRAAREAAASDGFGAFRVFGDGSVVGDFVSLRARAGVVSDYTLLTTSERVFRSVAAGDSSFGGATGLDATHLLLANDEAEVQASDVTSGYLKVVAKQATDVAFDLDDAVTPFRLGENVVTLQREGRAFGSMILTGAEGRPARGSAFELVDGGAAGDSQGPDGSAGPSRVVAHLQRGAQAIFRTHVGIETELDDADRALMDQAIAGGRVAGQVVVQTTAALAADKTATSAVTTAHYDDVQILSAATRSHVEVTVSSTTSTGRTLIVSLDRETLPGLAQGDGEILLDGEETAHADSYADVLDATDDDGRAEYFVLAGEEGTQVLVSIPHFSTRSVTLRERSAFAGPPVFMYATIFLSVLVAAETVFLARRRKEKQK